MGPPAMLVTQPAQERSADDPCDIAICASGTAMQPLGDAFIKAIRVLIAPIIFCTVVHGIARMADAFVTMDEALAQVIVDLSGRPYCVFDAVFTPLQIGAMSSSLVAHVFESIATHARMNLHARVLYGRDDHHKAEAVFKGLGRALDKATRQDLRLGGELPTTKEFLEK